VFNPAIAGKSACRYPVRAAAVLTALVAAIGAGFAAEPRHAIAMHGEPAYPPGFTHFRYANPDAPKGGRLTQAFVGTFDSINPFVIRGTPFQPVRAYVVESLLTRGMDEPFTLYAMIAKSVETDDKRSYVTFVLDPRARFSDGKPVTADDVLFSWRLLRDKGRPNHRLYYSKVVSAQKLAPDKVRFDFGDAADRELPLILGLMPILAQHATDPARFDEPSLRFITGSGPYTISEVNPGNFVVLKRSPDYWARDLPANRGIFNFDEMRFEFYRDTTAWFEAFKRRLYDFRFEEDPSRWNVDYEFPGARNNGLIREDFTTQTPRPFSAFVFNTRRAIFSDPRVREALTELFDFEWINSKLFFNAYARTASFFEGSALAARGVKASDRERALLSSYLAELQPEVLDGSYRPPVSDGSGQDRARMRRALSLLADAGWILRNGALVRKDNGAPFRFEILLMTREDERLATIYSTMLRRVGITADVRMVEGVQFETRRQGYDFDMIPAVWQLSLSPGNELYFYFGSESADRPGTRNYMGAKSAAIDAMIAAILNAKTADELATASRALDRTLLSRHYLIPLFHLPKQWLARWPNIERPAQTSLYGPLPDTWWQKRQQP
jgi:peptide/nickel transport system substrate-binding protein